MSYKIPEPIHRVSVNGYDYAFRRDFYGRYRVYHCGKDDKERDISRHVGYESIKEAWDRLFEMAVQSTSHTVGPAVDFARFVAENGTMGNIEIGAALAERAKEVIEKEGLPS